MCTESGMTHSQTDLHQMLHALGKLKPKNKSCLEKNLSFCDTFYQSVCFQEDLAHRPSFWDLKWQIFETNNDTAVLFSLWKFEGNILSLKALNFSQK